MVSSHSAKAPLLVELSDGDLERLEVWPVERVLRPAPGHHADDLLVGRVLVHGRAQRGHAAGSAAGHGNRQGGAAAAAARRRRGRDAAAAAGHHRAGRAALHTLDYLYTK